MQWTGEVHCIAQEERKYHNVKMELLQDLLAWELRAQDPLPLPRKRYIQE